MKKISVILDGDPGHDDAIAWVIAASLKELDIKAITTVAGNQTLAKTTLNARRIAALLDLDVPIAKGRAVPLLGNLFTAPSFHGESGLDGPTLPQPKRELEELSAPALMAKVLRESKEAIAIIATGPMTNVAAFLLSYPELKEKVKCISFMGGGLQKGNWTSAAEFNALVDPEAMDIVLKSNIPIIMNGLDVTEKALCYPEENEKIRKIGNAVSDAVSGWLDFFMKHLMSLGWAGATLHDPCAVLSLVHPELFTFREAYVEVELNGHYTRGATIADYSGFYNKKPNLKAAVDIKREAFIDLLIKSCEYYSKKEAKI